MVPAQRIEPRYSRFHDRADAGRELARFLASYRHRSGVTVAAASAPAASVAAEVAARLRAPLLEGPPGEHVQTIICVDDGSTAPAALRVLVETLTSVRAHKIIIATPLLEHTALGALADQAYGVVALCTREALGARSLYAA